MPDPHPPPLTAKTNGKQQPNDFRENALLMLGCIYSLSIFIWYNSIVSLDDV
jgi:hypothetical protein